MIKITFYQNKFQQLVGFECKNHGANIVCAAVSVLTMNTVNSIETFSESDFRLDIDEKNTGYMEFVLTGEIDDNATLLMNSLDLGIQGILQEYGGEIEVFVKEV